MLIANRHSPSHIPFKREGIYAREAAKGEMLNILTEKFQFPSNGKAYMHGGSSNTDAPKVHVSIPFKREGIYAQAVRFGSSPRVAVSIPFKREGIYAQVSSVSTEREALAEEVVSIPFKREGIYAQSYS